MNKSLKLLLDFSLTVLLLVVLFILYGLIPNRWYHILVVTSGSMAPTFFAGDSIVITRPPERLEPGMVLTMMVDGEIVTHRLVETLPDGQLITAGDANPTTDYWGEEEISVQGLYRFRIPCLGFLLQFLM